MFSINARATNQRIFKKLEKGFVETFENDYSRKLKRTRDSSLLVRVNSYQRQIKRIDSLQDIYLNILKIESENNNSAVTSSLFPLMQEKTKTKEFELFQEELTLREKANNLEEVLIEESEYFDLLSGFDEVGAKETDLSTKYMILLPFISIIIMAVFSVLMSVYKFIKDYE